MRTYVVFAALLALGCGKGTMAEEKKLEPTGPEPKVVADTKPTPAEDLKQSEREGYERKKAELEGANRAENEAAMQQYPEAGITPDMSAEERKARIEAVIQHKTQEEIEKAGQLAESMANQMREQMKETP